MVRDNKVRQMREIDQKGIKEYQKYIKEVEERQEALKKKERQISEQEYESYK